MRAVFLVEVENTERRDCGANDREPGPALPGEILKKVALTGAGQATMKNLIAFVEDIGNEPLRLRLDVGEEGTGGFDHLCR